MASGDILTNLGTPITINDGSTPALTFNSLANNAARVSARVDLGAWPRTRWYRWSLGLQWIATPTAGRTLDVFMAPWDEEGTPSVDFGIPGAVDAALTTTKRFNMIHIGGVRVEAAAVGPFQSGGLFECPWRYVSFAVYNDGGVALAATATYASTLRITPYYENVVP